MEGSRKGGWPESKRRALAKGLMMSNILLDYNARGWKRGMHAVAQTISPAQIREARRGDSLVAAGIDGVNEPSRQSESSARRHEHKTETKEAKV